jgi:hypothetical protein
MKRYVSGTIAALAAPAAAGALFLAPSATAAASTTAASTTAAPAAALQCQASVSNTRPKDHTTTYVTVSTAKGATVTTVAHYKAGIEVGTATANARGKATIGYAVGTAAPGSRVNVTVTVTSGRSHGSCSTSFIPQR